MEAKETIDQIDSCNGCGLCLDVCQTYEVTRNEAFSPMARFQAAKDVFHGNELTSEAVDSIYNCLKCQRCNVICPLEIDVTGIVRKAQIELVRRGIGPLERPNRIIEGIQKLGNAVNGDPAKRWDWLPEEFPKRESDTLFYVGCVACYLVPQAAISSYLLLRKLGVDFMILEDEGCCGDYLYNIGRVDLAKEKFEENGEKFSRLGIKRVITICAGCYHTFNSWYPELLGGKSFEVIHLAQLLPDLLRERKETLEKDERGMVYQDPCGLGRMEGIYDEPREALQLCGVKLVELEESREQAACCAAKNISSFRDLSIKVASSFLDKVKTPDIVTSCPFCLFGMNYACRKTGKDKKLLYLSEVILESLEHP